MTSPYTLLVDSLLMAFQLYAVLNPVSVIPTFMSLIGDRSRAEKAVAVRRASLYVVVLMAIFSILGGTMLKFLT
ncbi:hypothetical protein IG193_00225 [Infirmifilum lucidum]|uniref:UPF0056 membrane protein n=1 Tax=Infirmifilum lucidum TaxID=2776706 RepID=A0A7L9FGI0_9CREN|nr:MarC family protein [Infirmifilum lucidum]QOJ78928.1 hypothetical protein IG193_00225 [Infirmifilum lucidum]